MEPAGQNVALVGLEGAGHWVAAAAAQAGDAIGRVAADTAGFRFARLMAFDHPDFLPGGAKYHDLPGMLALCAPRPLWLAGEAEVPPVVRAAYQAAGATGAISLCAAPPEVRPQKVVDWLVGR